MSRDSFGSKFLLETSLIIILIFCLNFSASKMFLICSHLLSIFNLLTFEKLLLKSAKGINEVYYHLDYKSD